MSQQYRIDEIDNEIKKLEESIANREKTAEQAQRNIDQWRNQPFMAPLVRTQQQALDAVNRALKQEQQRLAQLQREREQILRQIEESRRRAEAERRAEQMQNPTRGGLLPATIYPVDVDGNPIETYFSGAQSDQLRPLFVMFNPSDYTIDKKNKYKVKGISNFNYNLEFDSELQPRTLSLSALWFDTSETGEDVRRYTDILMNYVEVGAGPGISFEKSAALLQQPPYVAFEWGTFRFLAVITSVALDFILFDREGTPLRAKATVSFKEFQHRKMYARQNPSSGGGPDSQLWQVSLGDRLDTIAADVYGDATKWRLIADYNGLLDPLALQPGQTLAIPSQWER
jgi:hypothetical protein